MVGGAGIRRNITRVRRCRSSYHLATGWWNGATERLSPLKQQLGAERRLAIARDMGYGGWRYVTPDYVGALRRLAWIGSSLTLGGGTDLSLPRLADEHAHMERWRWRPGTPVSGGTRQRATRTAKVVDSGLRSRG